MIPIRLINDTPFPVWDLFDHDHGGLTQSLLNKFNMCPEKMRLAEIEGLRKPGYKMAMEFGSLFHEMEAQVWEAQREHRFNADRAIQFSEDVLAKLEKVARQRVTDEALPSETLDDIAKTHGLVRATMIPYWRYWERDFLTTEFDVIEETWRMFYKPQERLGIKAPYIALQGKFDRIFRLQTGRIWLWETKTKGQIDANLVLKKVQFDLQTYLYLWAIEELRGEVPEGIRYNLVRKSGIRHGAKETLEQFCARVELDATNNPEFYFPRLDCTITPEKMAAWKPGFDAMMRRIIAWYQDMEANNFRDPSACTAYFGQCEYLDLCAYGSTTGFVRRQEIMQELDI